MIAVIGSGAFGTALAIAQARAGKPTTLVTRDKTLLDATENTRRLPDHVFPKSLTPAFTIPKADAYLLVVPAQSTRNWLETNPLPSNAPLVLCAKGLERGTLLRQSEIASEFHDYIAVLTGPGFADEIAAGKPTALTLAGSSSLQNLLSTKTLRLYRTRDQIGAELGGALKNVVALACGIAHGAGLGESAKAALLTRGLAEILRLGTALGAMPATFSGLSGLGDLTLTASSTQSRNFRAGIALAQNDPLDPAITVEGIPTAYATCELAKSSKTDVPLARAVVSVLDKSQTVDQAISDLLTRPLSEEG